MIHPQMTKLWENAHTEITGVFRKNAQGVLSENRFLTFVFLVQKTPRGVQFGKKILTTETILNIVLVFILFR